MTKPKTLKFVLKGELPAISEYIEMEDGSIMELKKAPQRIVVPSKKNQQRIAVNKKTLKPLILPSKQHEIWIKKSRKEFLDFKDHIVMNHDVRVPIVRAKIKVLFFFATGMDKDLSNKFETISDILVDTGIIADDSFKVLKPVTLDGWVNKQRPRTEIYLTILDPLKNKSEYEWDITPEEYYETIKARRNERKRVLRRRAVKPVQPEEPVTAAE